MCSSDLADLDWHNPEVRARVAEVVNFWRAHGVRAFRFDVINVIGKRFLPYRRMRH